MSDLKLAMHPTRVGYHLIVKGKTYSLINLGEPPLGSDDIHSTYKEIGKMYDEMGGRYEGILLPESNDGEWGSTFRGKDWEDLINQAIEVND